MRADLQRFYGLNLDRMDIDYTQSHAAACVACLPLGSALNARINPDFKVLLKDVPVSAIARALQKPVNPDEIEYGSMGIAEFDAWLKSKEVG